MLHKRVTTLAFLLLELSPLLVFELDFMSALQLEYPSQYFDDTWENFVCVEVLRPRQPNGVMSSVVSLRNHKFIGQA